MYNDTRREIGSIREVWCCRRHKKSTCDGANGKGCFLFYDSHYIVLPATNHLMFKLKPSQLMHNIFIRFKENREKPVFGLSIHLASFVLRAVHLTF